MPQHILHVSRCCGHTIILLSPLLKCSLKNTLMFKDQCQINIRRSSNRKGHQNIKGQHQNIKGQHQNIKDIKAEVVTHGMWSKLGLIGGRGRPSCDVSQNFTTKPLLHPYILYISQTSVMNTL